MRWLKNYFMLCGLLGHLLLASVWLIWPELVLNAKQKLRLELQGVGLIAAPTAVEAVASDLPAQRFPIAGVIPGGDGKVSKHDWGAELHID